MFSFYYFINNCKFIICKKVHGTLCSIVVFCRCAQKQEATLLRSKEEERKHEKEPQKRKPQSKKKGWESCWTPIFTISSASFTLSKIWSRYEYWLTPKPLLVTIVFTALWPFSKPILLSDEVAGDKDWTKRQWRGAALHNSTYRAIWLWWYNISCWREFNLM